MKITVIGVLGNIGKHLTKKLVEKGYQVTGADNKNESSRLLKVWAQFQLLGIWKI